VRQRLERFRSSGYETFSPIALTYPLKQSCRYMYKVLLHPFALNAQHLCWEVLLICLDGAQSTRVPAGSTREYVPGLGCFSRRSQYTNWVAQSAKERWKNCRTLSASRTVDGEWRPEKSCSISKTRQGVGTDISKPWWNVKKDGRGIYLAEDEDIAVRRVPPWQNSSVSRPRHGDNPPSNLE
jgi:hypothetical protein